MSTFFEPIKPPPSMPTGKMPEPAIDDDDEITLLRKELAQIEEESAEIDASVEQENEESLRLQAEIKRIRLETEAILNQMAIQRVAVEESIRAERMRRNELKRKASATKNKLTLLEQEARARKALEDNVTIFDSITAGLPWREWAHPYQLDGAKIMANNRRTINADEMGLGKTLQALMTCDMLQAQKVLVICPAELISNWEKEAARWAPHRLVGPFYRLDKLNRDTQFSIFSNLDQFLVLVNYEIWRHDPTVIDQLIGLNFDTVILDEAHNIKNTKTEAFRGARKIVLAENACPYCSAAPNQVETSNKHYKRVCPKCGWDSMVQLDYDIADRRSVKNVFPMTGTPILNRPQELFPILHLIIPEGFINERVFLDLYCEQDWETGYWKFRHGGLDLLSNSLRGRYIARKAEDVELNLPPQTIKVHELDFDEELYPDQARVMSQLKRHAAILLKSGKAVTAVAAIALITRQRQANTWPGGIQVVDPETKEILINVGDEVQESMKVDYAVDLIKKYVEEGGRCVLFSQFKSPLRAIAGRLSGLGITAATFDGDTPEFMRNRIKIDVDITKTDPSNSRYQVVLCNYATGGVGLDFTGMQHTIGLDDPWNPGLAKQAWRRTQRIGQPKETTVDILRIKSTIDTWMARLLEFKEGVVGGFDTMTQDLPQLLLDAIEGGDI